MAPANSRAASSGRLSAPRSASGTAAACNGVSMSPGSIARNRTPSAASSASQIGAQVPQRRLARAVGAPPGVGGDGRVAGDVQHDRATALAGGRGERAEDRLGQPERPEQVRGQRALQGFAVGVAEQRERRRAEVRGVVHQHVEAAECADDLEGDRVDVLLQGDVPDDPVYAGEVARHPLDAVPRPGDEGHPRAAAVQLPDEGQAQARGAPGDRDAKPREGVVPFIRRKGAHHDGSWS